MACNPKRTSGSVSDKRASKGGDIFSRLTDPTLYTGAHKQRFDESGKGRGKSGRVDDSHVNDLSQLTRANLRMSGKVEKTKIDLSNVQKFGTQASKAKFITVFANGDPNSPAHKILLGKGINSWDKLLLELTKTVRLATGPCKKLYCVVKGTDGNDHTKIVSVDSLEEGHLYLACGAEDISKDKYPKELEK